MARGDTANLRGRHSPGLRPPSHGRLYRYDQLGHVSWHFERQGQNDQAVVLDVGGDSQSYHDWFRISPLSSCSAELLRCRIDVTIMRLLVNQLELSIIACNFQYPADFRDGKRMIAKVRNAMTCWT